MSADAAAAEDDPEEKGELTEGEILMQNIDDAVLEVNIVLSYSYAIHYLLIICISTQHL